MKIDCHVHLVGSSESSGCYFSPRMRRSPSFLYLRRKFGLQKEKTPEAAERKYLHTLRSYVERSELDRAVLLAFDAVYGRDGNLDWGRTHTFVPNDYVYRACSENPSHFLLGASVHPYRKDALEELERVRENGAELVKLLPNCHGFDPGDRNLDPYWKKMSDLGLTLLVHGGFEHTIPPIDQALGDPGRLRGALDIGVTVVVAHAGSAGMMHFKETFGTFLRLYSTYANCFGDNSALTNFWRAKYLKQLLSPERIYRTYGIQFDNAMEKFIHGSDFPIPITPFAFGAQLTGSDRKKVRKITNPLQQDIELKRALGVPEACLSRTEAVLKGRIGRV